MAKITKAFEEILIVLIRLYQILLRPLTGHCCRFTPTCSAYAIDAVRFHGMLRGILLTVRRLGRCHPWTPGGADPVPLSKEKKCQAL